MISDYNIVKYDDSSATVFVREKIIPEIEKVVNSFDTVRPRLPVDKFRCCVAAQLSQLTGIRIEHFSTVPVFYTPVADGSIVPAPVEIGSETADFVIRSTVSSDPSTMVAIKIVFQKRHDDGELAELTRQIETLHRIVSAIDSNCNYGILIRIDSLNRVVEVRLLTRSGRFEEIEQ